MRWLLFALALKIMRRIRAVISKVQKTNLQRIESESHACISVNNLWRNSMNLWNSLVVAVALVGCATSSEEVADQPTDAAARVCVSVRSINSFDAVDDQHIYIKATGNNHYLFTLYGGCHGLRSAHGIAVKDTFTRVCSNSYGEIIFRDMGRRLESCRIRKVEAVASKDDAKGLVEDRKAEKREMQSESE
jgi:hypothetical protein